MSVASHASAHLEMNLCLNEGVCAVLMGEDAIEIKVGRVDDENEDTTWAEVWHKDELVHRSAHVTLKKWPQFISGEVGRL